MPRSGDGTYTLPSGTLVSTGDTLLASQHNPAMGDIAAALTGSLDRDGNGGMRADLPMGGHKVTGLDDGIDPSDAATVGQLSTGAGIPVGSVMDFAGSAAPSGWLVCGGQSLVRSEYAELYAVIGTTFGSASGSTFNLPDCRGRVIAGRDFDQSGNAGRLTGSTVAPNGTTLGAVGGAQTVTLTSDQMPAHTHTGSTDSAGDHAHSINFGTTGGNQYSAREALEFDDAAPTSTAGAHTHSITMNNTGGGSAHGNVQPTILLNKIIRASSS